MPGALRRREMRRIEAELVPSRRAAKRAGSAPRSAAGHTSCRATAPGSVESHASITLSDSGSPLPLLVSGSAVATGLATWRILLGIPCLVIVHLPFVLAYELLVLAPASTVACAGVFNRVVLVPVPTVGSAVAAPLFVGLGVSLARSGTSLIAGADITRSAGDASVSRRRASKGCARQRRRSRNRSLGGAT